MLTFQRQDLVCTEIKLMSEETDVGQMRLMVKFADRDRTQLLVTGYEYEMGDFRIGGRYRLEVREAEPNDDPTRQRTEL